MARGSVSKRNGLWCFRIDVGLDPATGKRRQISRQGFTTKRAADAALNEAMSSLATGSMVKRSSETVASFLDSWLVSQQPRVRATTLHSYGIIVRRISAQIGNVALQSLTALHIERLYADLLARGGRGGGELSAKSVRNTHVVLHKALKDAERLGLIVRNPASSAAAPRATRPEFTSWSSDDARDFFDAIADHRMRAAYVLLVTTGMRRGEALGLRWSDVDLDGRQLAIVQTLNSINGRLVFSAPKTARSRRTVFLDVTTVDALRAHHKRQVEERLVLGVDWDARSNHVFRDRVGGPVKPDWFSKEFDRLVHESGLPRLRLHDYADVARYADVFAFGLVSGGGWSEVVGIIRGLRGRRGGCRGAGICRGSC